MTLYEMPSVPTSGAHRSFQVDPASNREFAQVGPTQRLWCCMFSDGMSIRNHLHCEDSRRLIDGNVHRPSPTLNHPCFPSNSVTVKHAPFTQMLSPMLQSASIASLSDIVSSYVGEGEIDEIRPMCF